MELTNPEDLRIALQLAGLRPRKGLGQHFLVDSKSLEIILASAEITKDDCILEVGPGLGVMTGKLTERAGQVVAVETDRYLAEVLRRDQPKNLTIVESDILDYDLRELPTGYKVVANIPYYLTSNLLRALLESSTPPALMVLLIQKEVAERIVAKPGDLSILALSVQYYAEAEIIEIVERFKFWPAPKVDSAIIRIKMLTMPRFAADHTKLFRLIKAGFGEKRKQLKNALAGGLNLDVQAVTDLLKQAKIKPAARAQELSLNDWQRLYTSAMDKDWL